MRKLLLMAAFVLSSLTLPAQVPTQASPVPQQRPRVVLIAPGPPAGAGRAIWVLQANNQLALYDSAQFKQWRTLALPAEARQHPENLIFGHGGQVLYRYQNDGRSVQRFWSSDPRYAELQGGAYEERPADGGGSLITSAAPAVYFSLDGEHLLWFENREQRLSRGPDVWRDASFLAWTTDSDGRNPAQFATFDFPRCTCETGACEETCPEAQVWAPEEGVSDFFFVTRWIPGQTDATYQETDLYQRMNNTWTSHRLARPVERILDAVDHGNLFVSTVGDGGCCGWANEGDDAGVITRNGGDIPFFDELQRFHNQNYDVSFFVQDAAFSPDTARLAYTVAATQKPGEEIRLADSGKANPEELARIQKLLPQMPQLEMILLSAPKTVVFGIPSAEFVGWLDNQRLLAYRNGELLVVDAASGKTTSTGIKADGPKFVFIQELN